MVLIKLIIFVLISAGLVYVSWKPLRQPRSHGFYRFFAWESILALILVNAEAWFHDPFSVLQVISWLLLICSIVLVTYGIYLLHVIGRPRTGIEDTTRLVIVGIYKYIRHPLYSSLLFLAWGAFLKDVSPLSSALVLAASLFLIATARVEESENLEKFGSEYADYMKKTTMFIPYIL
jgi:protein-S-isoprenylcysteine O-methyltransferase Ste14